MTWIELIYSLPFILMGGCIFSFADVVADRLPRKISFVKGRSYCPSCGHTLAWYDMIPVSAGCFLEENADSAGVGFQLDIQLRKQWEWQPQRLVYYVLEVGMATGMRLTFVL